MEPATGLLVDELVCAQWRTADAAHLPFLNGKLNCVSYGYFAGELYFASRPEHDGADVHR